MGKKVIAVGLLALGLVAGVLLLGKNADLRRSADASSASVYFVDSSGNKLGEIEGQIGQPVSLQLMVDSLNVPMNSADIRFTFDPAKLEIVSITKTTAFQTQVRNTIGNGAARLNLVKDPPDFPTGVVHVADVVVKPLQLPANLNFGTETMLTQFNVASPISANLIGVTLIDQKKNTTPSASAKDFTIGLFAGPISQVGSEISFKLFAKVPQEARFDSYALDLSLPAGGGWIFASSMGNSSVNSELFNPSFTKNGDRSISIYGLRRVDSTSPNSSLPSGDVELATIKLTNTDLSQNATVLSVGNYEFTAWKGTSFDASATVGLQNTSLSITPDAAAPTTGGLVGNIQFKLSFSGLMDYVTSVCAKPQTVDVIIKGTGVDKEYKKVPITKSGNYCRVWNSGENKCDLFSAVYTASVSTEGLPNPLENASILVRGPLEVTTKFGEDGQNQYYNALQGKLRIVPGAAFDFSKYPLSPGDTNGDDVVNGLDYAELIKNLGNSNLGSYDMDFNCTINAQDLNLLKLTLSERQAQKY